MHASSANYSRTRCFDHLGKLGLPRGPRWICPPAASCALATSGLRYDSVSLFYIALASLRRNPNFLKRASLSIMSESRNSFAATLLSYHTPQVQLFYGCGQFLFPLLPLIIILSSVNPFYNVRVYILSNTSSISISMHMYTCGHTMHTQRRMSVTLLPPHRHSIRTLPTEEVR